MFFFFSLKKSARPVRLEMAHLLIILPFMSFSLSFFFSSSQCPVFQSCFRKIVFLWFYSSWSPFEAWVSCPTSSLSILREAKTVRLPMILCSFSFSPDNRCHFLYRRRQVTSKHVIIMRWALQKFTRFSSRSVTNSKASRYSRESTSNVCWRSTAEQKQYRLELHKIGQEPDLDLSKRFRERCQ